MDRFDFDDFFRIDCLRVTPQTYIFFERGDRDLSIARIGVGEKLLYSKISTEE